MVDHVVILALFRCCYRNVRPCGRWFRNANIDSNTGTKVTHITQRQWLGFLTHVLVTYLARSLQLALRGLFDPLSTTRLAMVIQILERISCASRLLPSPPQSSSVTTRTRQQWRAGCAEWHSGKLSQYCDDGEGQSSAVRSGR